MAILTYDGSASDHTTIPEVLKTGDDGKPMKRRIIRPARTVTKPIDEYNLRGQIFPKGEAAKVTDIGIIKKACAIGCFEVQIQEDEPITKQKEWLAKAVEADKVSVVKKLGSAEPPKAAASDSAGHVTNDDGYDQLSREDLIRMAGAYGISVHGNAKKETIIKKLRESEEAARGEAIGETDGDESEAWMANAEDVG